MKKIFSIIALALAVATTSCMLTSCGSDDDSTSGSTNKTIINYALADINYPSNLSDEAKTAIATAVKNAVETASNAEFTSTSATKSLVESSFKAEVAKIDNALRWELKMASFKYIFTCGSETWDISTATIEAEAPTLKYTVTVAYYDDLTESAKLSDETVKTLKEAAEYAQSQVSSVEGTIKTVPDTVYNKVLEAVKSKYKLGELDGYNDNSKQYILFTVTYTDPSGNAKDLNIAWKFFAE